MQRFLIDYDMAMLRALAQSRGAELATNQRLEAAEHLAVALLDPLSVRAALARLSPGAREALAALLAAGGRLRAPQFTRRFGAPRPIGPGRLEREEPWREPANPAEELVYLGLAFRAFHEDEGGPGEFVFVPTDLIPLLPQPENQETTFALEIVPAPDPPPAEAGDLTDDLFAYLVYLQTHDVRPYADGRLGRRDRSALLARLSDADGRRFDFLRHLAGRLGFVHRQGEFLRLVAAPVKGWLTAPPAHRQALLQHAWRDDPAWNDLCRVPGLECDQATPWQNDPLATRQALLALLARCPLDRWWTLASFVAAVKASQPDFQRPDGDYTTWYLRAAASGEYLSGFEAWDQVEGALIADLLSGPLRWLAVVAVGGPPSAPLCRLTEVGARFLELLPPAEAAVDPPPIVIRPDFRVEVPPPVNLYACFQLERFAERERAGPGHYRLTVAGLGRALSRDIRSEQILAFLRQASGDRLPVNVAGQLQLWAGRFGQVTLEEVALLTVEDERVLKELSVLPETRAFVQRAISPTAALIRRRHLPPLRKALRELGYLLPEEEADS